VTANLNTAFGDVFLCGIWSLAINAECLVMMSDLMGCDCSGSGCRLGGNRSSSLGEVHPQIKTATMRYEKNRCGACCAFGVDACLGG
jgi:hypothetical protein